MKAQTIIGVDVSKLKLDSVLLPASKHLQITNNKEGFAQWLQWLKRHCTQMGAVLVVMEDTGHYTHLFELFLQAHRIGYVKKPAIEIKNSSGLIRGKSDLVDAARIAQYGWLRREELSVQPCPAEVIMKLRDLLSYRYKLVKDRSGYKVRLKEALATGRISKSDFLYHEQVKDILYFDKKIVQVEKQIWVLLKASTELQKNFQLLQTIKGVGKITAAYMVAYTNNFTRFTAARKFNCYAGLAPFEHSSGKSIRGKSRVSHLANKHIKCVLRLAAFVCVRYNQELKQYYERRVKEGKSKMSVINIIGSKLISRMFAVVRKQTPYIEQPQQAA
jgi:transposase